MNQFRPAPQQPMSHPSQDADYERIEALLVSCGNRSSWQCLNPHSHQKPWRSKTLLVSCGQQKQSMFGSAPILTQSRGASDVGSASTLTPSGSNCLFPTSTCGAFVFSAVSALLLLLLPPAPAQQPSMIKSLLKRVGVLSLSCLVLFGLVA